MPHACHVLHVPCQSTSTFKVVPSAFRLLLSAASLRELQNKQRHVTAINRRVELGNSTESTFIHFYDGCSSSASCGRRHSGTRLPEQPDTGGCQRPRGSPALMAAVESACSCWGSASHGPRTLRSPAGVRCQVQAGSKPRSAGSHGPDQHPHFAPLCQLLSAGAWSRILTAVRDNGLNTRTIAVLDELHSYIRDHVPIVVVATADMLPAPVLGVGTNAAQRQLVAQIRYVGLANLASLEINTGALALTAPWTVICKLAGAIGAVGTQAARMVETAPVQAVAEVIRTHGAGGATDAAMAFQLRSNVMRAVLPKVLRAPNVTSGEQCEELADSFVYKASESDRRAIEQKRLDFIAHWYACMRLLS